MRRTRTKLNQTKPEWLGKARQCTKRNPITLTRYTYEGFQFNGLTVYVGDHVLVSNADADEPADTLEGCDVARIEHLFESTDRKGDKYRANVQWYSIPSKIPKSIDNDVMDDKYEIVEDCRKFDSNVSIETIRKKCSVINAYGDDIPEEVYHKNKKKLSDEIFVCRYRLRQIRQKFFIEPVLQLDDMLLNSEEGNSLSASNNGDKKFMPNSIVIKEKEENLSKSEKGLKKTATNLRSDSSTPKKIDSRLRFAFRKCSIDSDSETPKTVSSTKHPAVGIQDSDYENSPQSTPRKISSRRSSRNETPLKSNRFNTLGLESNNSNAEKDQSQIISRNKTTRNSDNTNVVVKDIPTKTYLNSPRRKRKVFRSSSEESLEPRSPSLSPKINCIGPPSVYKLYETNGHSFIIKKPIDIERKESKKKLDNSSISCLLSSDDSDSDTILKKLKNTGTKIVARSKSDNTGFELLNSPNKNVGLLENISEHDEAGTPKSARRNLSQTLGIGDQSDARKDLLLKKIADKREDASLRIKLRRSSEQSNYKIDSDSDNNLNHKSRRRTVLGTPKSILKVDSKGPGTPSVQFSNKDEINEYSPTSELSEKLLKVEIKLKRVDTHGVRTSPRNRKANSRYSDYYEVVKMPIPNDGTPNKRLRKIVNYREDDNCNTTPRRTRYSKSNSEQVKTLNIVSETNEKNSTRMITSEIEDVEQSRTPRKSKRTISTDDIKTPSRKGSRTDPEEIEPVITPKRNVHTPKLQTPSRSVKTGLLTPSMHQRIIRTAVPSTPLQEARARLHVSAVPKSLPCREEEFNNIYTFLEGKLIDNSGGCLYISGVPGTGKTATVNEVIRCLKKSVSKGKVSNFDFIEINAMKLTEPRQAYVEILKQLTGKKSTWEQAQQLLDKRFTTAAPRRLMTLLLVDELDILCNKRQDVVYNLLDWPAKSSARLVVITIANTMDLPERVLMGRVTSRLGLTRLTFQPYTHKQLQEIVTARLNDSHAFKSEAVQLVARKVAAVSGDARRALDICRRATEVAEFNNSEIVSMQDVNEALTEMIASVKVQAIRHCSEMEQTFLQAVCSEVARTGVEEVIFKNIYIQLQSLCSLEGLEEPSVTDAMTICAKLGAYRLLICEHSRADIHQRVLLNVSSDDVHFALQNIEV